MNQRIKIHNKLCHKIRDNEQPNRAATTEMLTAFPDAVHVAKNDRASYANWYRFVDGNRINLVLLRTACTGRSTWNICLCLELTSRWLLVATEPNGEICSPEVQQGLANTKLIVQTLIPDVYRIYEANKEGVLRSPVSVCPLFWGTILISGKDEGKIFSAR